MKSPNFLLIVTDQHRADHLGCYGNPIVRTPHIDGIAARGWRSDASSSLGDLHAESRDAHDRPNAVGARRAPQRHPARSRSDDLSRSAAGARLSHGAARQSAFAKHDRRTAGRARRPTLAPVRSHRRSHCARRAIASESAAYDQELRRSCARSHAPVASAVLWLRRRRAVPRVTAIRSKAITGAGCVRALPDADGHARSGWSSTPRAGRCRAASVAHAHSRRTLSDELRRPSKRKRGCSGTQRTNARTPVLRAVLVSRSASPVHAARPLLVDVRSRRHSAAAVVPAREPALAAAPRAPAQ